MGARAVRCSRAGAWRLGASRAGPSGRRAGHRSPKHEAEARRRRLCAARDACGWLAGRCRWRCRLLLARAALLPQVELLPQPLLQARRCRPDGAASSGSTARGASGRRRSTQVEARAQVGGNVGAWAGWRGGRGARGGGCRPRRHRRGGAAKSGGGFCDGAGGAGRRVGCGQ